MINAARERRVNRWEDKQHHGDAGQFPVTLSARWSRYGVIYEKAGFARVAIQRMIPICPLKSWGLEDGFRKEYTIEDFARDG